MTLDRNIVKKKTKVFKRMYRNGIKYSFTFNFNNDHQYFNSNSANRIHEIFKSYKSILLCLDNCSSYSLYPEFSTPNSTSSLSKKKTHQIMGHGYGNTGCRFHVHGTIQFNDVMNFYIVDYINLLKYGLFEIDTIDDPKLWLRYCTKDKEIMEPYIKSYSYIYNMETSDIVKQKGKK